MSRHKIHRLSWATAKGLAAALIPTINALPRIHSMAGEPYRVYGIPRGGWNALALLPQSLVTPVDFAQEADFLLDDIIDSGKTRDNCRHTYGPKPFLALIDKLNPANVPAYEVFDGWVRFPWESEKEESGPEDNVRRILQYIGEDPNREGLHDTPKRFLKMMKELTCGYAADPSDHLRKVFTLDDSDSGLSGYDEIILSGPLPFVSLCEHHLAAFDGVAFIGYLPGPGGKVVGLSKLARLLDGFSNRLQVQERLTTQIADAVETVLKPQAVGVVIKGRHTCQCFRGVRKDGRMVTSAMRGEFRNSPPARAEFLQLMELAQRGT